ncbi:uncharacterized protein LOC124496560 [Dermatophagoides farinae]|uniref:uncharacterized protein LOC124496560 n=1 Tax=Dermatophagoides farinae TaxID=6954 RepID=UPI003F6390B0
MDSNNAMIIAENIQQPTATDIVSLDVNITDNNSSTSVATSLASTSNISVDPALVVVSSSSTLTATGIVGNDSQHIIQMVTESPQQQQPPPHSTTETNVIDNQLLQQSTVMINDNNSTPTSTSIFAAAPVTTSITTTAVPASVQLPIKITGSTQPIFVSNQGIIAAAPTGTTNVSTLANTFVSYILPTQNSLQKSSSLQKSDNQSTTTIVSAAPNISTETVSTTALINTPIVINAPVSDTTSIQPQKLVTSTNPANVKLIQSTNQRHLVFSPIKPTIGNVVGNTTLMTKSIAGTKSNQRIVDGTILAAAPNTSITNQSQQQQLIILSPVKPGGNSTTKPTQFIPSFKILPPSSSSTTANVTMAPSVVTTSQSSKRALAPAPITKTIVSSITPANVRPIQATTTNKNIQYISFVPYNSTQQITATGIGSTTTAGQISTKYLPIKQSKSSSAIKSTNLVQVGHGQKVIVNPNTIKISGTATTLQSSITTTIASTTTTTTASATNKSKNHATSVWMLPKQIIKANDSHGSSKSGGNLKYVPIAPNPNVANNTIGTDGAKITVNTVPKNLIDGFEETRRKPCNCTRSQCLKLYCDCFANGEFCSGCNCLSCCNNLEHEELRQKAIRLCLDRNPNAFHPKIGQSNHGDIERRHTKGCCCKRSGCLKNYCECYEAKILCSDKCKCVGCKNFEESDERKTLMHLADAAIVRSIQQQTVASKMHVWGPEFKSKLPVKVKSDCHPFNVLTNDILEATASCLLAQAEEGEFENLKEENIESLILDQFGECLSQILNLANNGMADDDGNTDDDIPMNDDVDCQN